MKIQNKKKTLLQTANIQVLRDGTAATPVLIRGIITLIEYSEDSRTKEVLTVLERLLGNGSRDVRRYAAIALGKLGMVEGLPALMRASSDPEVQAVALHAIRTIGLQAMESAAKAALESGNDEAKREAILAIGESGFDGSGNDREMRETLEQLAQSENTSLARMAQRVLENNVE